MLRIRIPDFYLTGSGSDFSKGADMDPTKYVEVSKLSQIVATFAKENLINFIKKIYFQLIFIQNTFKRYYYTGFYTIHNWRCGC